MKKNVLSVIGRSLTVVTSGLLVWALLLALPLNAAGATGSAASRMTIQGEPFAGLDRQEPLLAGLLLGAVKEDADHQSFLALEPYFSGMTAGPQGSFKLHGAFLPRPDGSAGFIFDLDSTRDRSSITYSGVIHPNAAAVVYTRVSRDSLSAKGQMEKAQWPPAE